TWKGRHPETTVLAPEPQLKKEYKRNPYGSYSSSDLLRFPVEPLPSESGPGLKERIAVLGPPGAADPVLVSEREPPSEPVTVPARYAYWFAWYATHPGTAIPAPRD
ncbi:MAG: DUF3179 domain-containing protein, partial [Candidatus Eisenbacteria bacterium]|nr:DUF3179 domain-containing protein [Candidatus Latescibacterota bacterium]MBD3301369.1 DUF3179 domain-containing protein [Candidatus Eisenbacteria bacterium]